MTKHDGKPPSLQPVSDGEQPIFFDLEADGLKDTVTRIWCITWDDGTNVYHYGPDQIDLAINHLHDHWLVGHNSINYDFEVIRKFYPWFKPSKVDDTFVLSSLFEPDRDGHGLADWGKQFGVPKPVHEDWTQYSPEMKHRNIEDVRITRLVWEHLQKERRSWDWEDAIRLEYKIAQIHAQQEKNGVGFDLPAAFILDSRRAKEIEEIDRSIMLEVPPKWVQVGVTVEKPFLLNGEYSKRAKAFLDSY
jgi:DNA polymerase I-like protein with 3'-5' exonuclease and polymerase domains